MLRNVLVVCCLSIAIAAIASMIIVTSNPVSDDAKPITSEVIGDPWIETLEAAGFKVFIVDNTVVVQYPPPLEIRVPMYNIFENDLAVKNGGIIQSG